MSLYRNLINESLQDDQRINQEVLMRLKKNYKDTNEALKADEAENISDFQQFKQMIINLLNMIDTVILEIEEDTDLEDINFIDLKDYIPKITDIILKYNNIVFSLIKNKFNLLSQNKKSNYFDFINKLKQSINTLAAHLYTYTEDNKTKRDLIDTLELILDNINNRTLEPVGIDDTENIQDRVDITNLSRKQQKKINELNIKIMRRNRRIARERREEDERLEENRNDEDEIFYPKHTAEVVAREREAENERRAEKREAEDRILDDGDDALLAEINETLRR